MKFPSVSEGLNHSSVSGMSVLCAQERYYCPCLFSLSIILWKNTAAACCISKCHILQIMSGDDVMQHSGDNCKHLVDVQREREREREREGGRE
jgi:hypothetical protein